MNNNDLDFLQTLIAAQRANPQNAAIFNLALDRAGNIFEDPQEQQKKQLVDMLTKAQVSRFAETGDTGALDMINTLFSEEDPIAALRKGGGGQNTAGLMQQAQRQFDEQLQPRIKSALESGDLETAEKLSSFTPQALRQLDESGQEVERKARDIAATDARKKLIGEVPSNIVGGLDALTNIALPGSYFVKEGIKNFLPQTAPTEQQRQQALRSRISGIYDTLAAGQ